MSRPPAPGLLGSVELLCNTANFVRGSDELGTVAGARAWATRHGLPGKLDPEHREDLVRARETIRDFLFDRGDPHAREELNRLAATILGPPAVSIDGLLWFTPSGAGQVAACAAPALSALLTEGLTGDGRRLKACSGPGCRWIFFDRAPSANGRWCDMAVCGARHKMRRYRHHPPAR